MISRRAIAQDELLALIGSSQRRPVGRRHPRAAAAARAHRSRRWCPNASTRARMSTACTPITSADSSSSGPLLRPCTPYGCMTLLRDTGVDLVGKHAVIIGQSNIVGRPMALELLDGALHGHRLPLRDARSARHRAPGRHPGCSGGQGEDSCRATGSSRGQSCSTSASNRDAEGKLCGDIDFAAAKERASWITPVPGGVGPMTIATLLSNTLLAAELRDGNAGTSPR